MIQLTTGRTGCIGRAYRQSPYPWDKIEVQMIVATQMPIECVLADELIYALRLQADIRS